MYHLLNKPLWYKFVNSKFENIYPSWLIEDITKYSSVDFEFILRELYEEIYAIQCDKGHAYWKAHLLQNSIVSYDLSLGNKWVAIILNSELYHNGNSYWNNLIFSILELRFSSVSGIKRIADKLDLSINLRLNKKHLLSEILENFNIEYDRNSLKYLLQCRDINFGYSNVDQW